MFDVELADTAVEPLRQFGAGLADAGKDDVLGRHARGQRAFQFAARNDVSAIALPRQDAQHRSEEHTSELQSLMRISYAVFCLKKKHHNNKTYEVTHI